MPLAISWKIQLSTVNVLIVPVCVLSFSTNNEPNPVTSQFVTVIFPPLLSSTVIIVPPSLAVKLRFSILKLLHPLNTNLILVVGRFSAYKPFIVTSLVNSISNVFAVPLSSVYMKLLLSSLGNRTIVALASAVAMIVARLSPG